MFTLLLVNKNETNIKIGRSSAIFSYQFLKLKQKKCKNDVFISQTQIYISLLKKNIKRKKKVKTIFRSYFV